jgi:hypothetical protein
VAAGLAGQPMQRAGAVPSGGFFGLRFLRWGFVVARDSQARRALGRARFTMAMPAHAATQKQRLKESGQRGLNFRLGGLVSQFSDDLYLLRSPPFDCPADSYWLARRVPQGRGLLQSNRASTLLLTDLWLSGSASSTNLCKSRPRVRISITWESGRASIASPHSTSPSPLRTEI